MCSYAQSSVGTILHLDIWSVEGVIPDANTSNANPGNVS